MWTEAQAKILAGTEEALTEQLVKYTGDPKLQDAKGQDVFAMTKNVHLLAVIAGSK